MSPEHSQEIADLDASLAQLVEPPAIQGDGGSSPSAGPQKGPASEARLIAQWKQAVNLFFKNQPSPTAIKSVHDEIYKNCDCPNCTLNPKPPNSNL